MQPATRGRSICLVMSSLYPVHAHVSVCATCSTTNSCINTFKVWMIDVCPASQHEGHPLNLKRADGWKLASHVKKFLLALCRVTAVRVTPDNMHVCRKPLSQPIRDYRVIQPGRWSAVRVTLSSQILQRQNKTSWSWHGRKMRHGRCQNI